MRVLFSIPTRPSPTFEEPQNWSPEIKDFVSKCLVKNTVNRPSALTLLSHPFITKYKSQQSDILKKLVTNTTKLIDSQGGIFNALQEAKTRTIIPLGTSSNETLRASRRKSTPLKGTPPDITPEDKKIWEDIGKNFEEKNGTIRRRKSGTQRIPEVNCSSLSQN